MSDIQWWERDPRVIGVVVGLWIVALLDALL